MIHQRHFCTHVLGYICLVVCLVFDVQSQDHEWIKIDDFESSNLTDNWILADTRNDTNPKIEHPQVTEISTNEIENNQYLIKKPAREGVVGNRKALSFVKLPKRIGIGETFTFYLRIKVEYFPNNHVFGLSNLDPEGIVEQDYNALEPTLRVTDKYESNGLKNDGTLMVRKGDAYDKIQNFAADRFAYPLQPQTWYKVWIVINNGKLIDGGQTYDVYLQGGSEFPQQQQVYVEADFRMKRELPLSYFLANCNTGPIDKPYGNGGLMYDDLYMIEGEALTSPTH